MRIAVSSWSFRDALFKGRIQLADVPAAVAALGIQGVELNDQFFATPAPGPLGRLFGRARRRAPTGPDYSPSVVRPVRHALIRAEVDLVALALTTDLSGDAGAKQQLDYLGTGLAAARVLDTALLRLSPGGHEHPGEEELKRAGTRLLTMVAAARASKIRLAVENDGGMATDPDALVALIEMAGKGFTGVCLDLGNFRPGEGRAGIRRLAPYALHVHAKAREFAPDGEETQIDYGDALAALREVGYDGAISIEYEGPGEPAEGIRRTRELIEKHW